VRREQREHRARRGDERGADQDGGAEVAAGERLRRPRARFLDQLVRLDGMGGNGRCDRRHDLMIGGADRESTPRRDKPSFE
jgi:hypothetical protein